MVSWFKPEDKSRGVVEDVRIDGSRELLDDALRQVRAARALFGGAGEIDRKVDVVAVPFVLGSRDPCRALRSSRDNARRAYRQRFGFDERSVCGGHCRRYAFWTRSTGRCSRRRSRSRSGVACGRARWRFAAQRCGGVSDSLRGRPTTRTRPVCRLAWSRFAGVRPSRSISLMPGKPRVQPAVVRNRSRHTLAPSGSEANRRRTAHTN